MKHSFFLFILCFAVAGLYAQNAGSVPTRGNTPAEKYFLMIQRLVDENKRNEARAALDKAMDFASELSDIPYLRALMDSQENKSRYAVLDSVVQALNVSRWIYYTEEQARFMAARQLIALRQYPAALEQLSGIRESADRAVLTLTALKGMLLASGSGADIDQRRAEFRRSILDAMEKYPGDPRPLRIFFEYSGSVFPGGAGNLPGEGRTPGDEDYYLMELVLRQLPLV
ncbi:MAG: hypothetical protein FWF29_01800, partial [Treponema sp.]|nr:hypothetical protein [Treponema sp.]